MPQNQAHAPLVWSDAVKFAMEKAISEAQQYRGSTSPNPPVGAVALDRTGEMIGFAAHERAGQPHAEAKLIEQLREQGRLEQVETLVVTLEPCNHTGRTPPCTQSIVDAGISKVIFGVRDPNPLVAGGGKEALEAAGIFVREGLLKESCAELIAPFNKWLKTRTPWVTIKTAHRFGSLSMIPPKGQKTFTSEDSLIEAHALRKRCDAIVTSAKTILIDHPLFTVRKVPDFEAKKRYLMVIDRNNLLQDQWEQSVKEHGMIPLKTATIHEALFELGKRGVLEVLIEAGPTLSKVFFDEGLWDEHVQMIEGAPLAQGTREQDQVIVTRHPERM